MNRCIAVLQTTALPLGYATKGQLFYTQNRIVKSYHYLLKQFLDLNRCIAVLQTAALAELNKRSEVKRGQQAAQAATLSLGSTANFYSTVTLLARLRGLSTSQPFSTAI